MYEEYYGFTEKPFSLTPDPKYLFKSESHANAFELLQYANRRREGFVMVTGDIGTGKTTLCRALLEQIDRNTFTALVLNPFLSEEDLLKLILQDFGVVSREDVKRGRLAGVSKQELIETIYDFLLGLLPLRASAVLIIDEAQNLPMPVLEQIRILSNLETDKEKLLQIVLVGQLNLNPLLKAPQMRQLDQRVSIRYQLKPLTRDEVAAYVSHRLTIAGGSAVVSFQPKALDLVHRRSGRHSAPGESVVRPRAAGGVFRAREQGHGGDGGEGRGEPRAVRAEVVALRLVSQTCVGGGDGRRRHRVAGGGGRNGGARAARAPPCMRRLGGGRSCRSAPPSRPRAGGRSGPPVDAEPRRESLRGAGGIVPGQGRHARGQRGSRAAGRRHGAAAGAWLHAVAGRCRSEGARRMASRAGRRICYAG